jgi:uncharacterized membrane protein YbhN (UPF0104 family)
MPESVERGLSAISAGYGHTDPVDEATPTPPPRSSRLVRTGRIAFAVVVLGVLVVVAARHLDELRDVDLDPAPQWLLVAAPFTFAGGILLPLAWRHTLHAYGVTLSPAVAVRVWCVSQASRFVPGSVALLATRVLLAAREGVPHRLAASTLGIEIGLIVVWGGLIGAGVPSSRVPGALRLVSAVGCATLLLAAPALLRRGPGSLRPGRMYEAIGLYGLNNLVTATGAAFVAGSLHPLAPHDLVLVVAAVNLAAVVGTIGVTPAGLGVREGVIAVLLGPTVGAGDAAAIAGAMRAWDFTFELVWIGIALAWERRQLGSTRNASA